MWWWCIHEWTPKCFWLEMHVYTLYIYCLQRFYLIYLLVQFLGTKNTSWIFVNKFVKYWKPAFFMSVYLHNWMPLSCMDDWNYWMLLPISSIYIAELTPNAYITKSECISITIQLARSKAAVWEQNSTSWAPSLNVWECVSAWAWHGGALGRGRQQRATSGLAWATVPSFEWRSADFFGGGLFGWIRPRPTVMLWSCWPTSHVGKKFYLYHILSNVSVRCNGRKQLSNVYIKWKQEKKNYQLFIGSGNKNAT